MTLQTLLITISILGFIIHIFVLRLPHRGEITLSNAAGGSQVGFVFLSAWITSVAIFLIFDPPHNLFQFYILLFFLGFMTSIGVMFYSKAFRLDYYPYDAHRYTSLIAPYWVAYIRQEGVMMTGHPYALKIGFRERECDVRLNFDYQADPKNPDEKKWIDDLFDRNLFLELHRYEEVAMVFSGNLMKNCVITMMLSAPAFSLEHREYLANIDLLKKNPLVIPVFPKQKGNHEIVFDFFDEQNQRCGGLAVPVKVREREPILGERALRILQWTGGILGLLSAILVIIEKVVTLKVRTWVQPMMKI